MVFQLFTNVLANDRSIGSEWPTIRKLARLLFARAFVGTNPTDDLITYAVRPKC